MDQTEEHIQMEEIKAKDEVEVERELTDALLPNNSTDEIINIPNQER